MEKEKCSFCNRTAEEANILIAGPNGIFICDECIDVCQSILDKKEAQKESNESFVLPTPEQIKTELDKYVVGQDLAKRTLSVAVYNHYKRINSPKDDELELEKSNILMLGPTGCGKTLLAKTLARILKVPFAVADATTLTEAGYVGEDVENVLLKLIQNADYDVSKAERGIIYIDEVDKIARKSENMSITRDVSGEGVQQALLKIIEGTVSSVPPQGGRKHPQQEMITINTTNILFICAGAFIGLDKIVNKRVQERSLGFGSEVKVLTDIDSAEIVAQSQPQDYIKYGLIPEFVGRLPIVVGLSPLDETALVKILTEPKNSLIKQYVKMFKIDNIDLSFTPKALSAIAERSIKLKTGARGLRAILERLLLDYMYLAPSDVSIAKIEVTEDCVKNGKPPKVVHREKTA